MPGPIPERSEDRIRRNKPEIPIEKIEIIGDVGIPELGLVDPDPMVVDIYESMKDAGQKRYFEPTDWQYARLTMRLLDQELKKSTFSAVKLQALNQMMSNLLMTEGDRRRVRIEIERQKSESNNVVHAEDLFREWVSKGG